MFASQRQMFWRSLWLRADEEIFHSLLIETKSDFHVVNFIRIGNGFFSYPEVFFSPIAARWWIGLREIHRALTVTGTPRATREFLHNSLTHKIEILWESIKHGNRTENNHKRSGANEASSIVLCNLLSLLRIPFDGNKNQKIEMRRKEFSSINM